MDRITDLTITENALRPVRVSAKTEDGKQFEGWFHNWNGPPVAIIEDDQGMMGTYSVYEYTIQFLDRE